MLSHKQKAEIAAKYMADRGISFGNAMADERACEMFIDALTYSEEVYEHTINEFKQAFLTLQKQVWDEQFKYLSNKIKK